MSSSRRPDRMSFREGQQIGQYVVERVLGTGGMAIVWRAWDLKRQKPVAIKVVADDFADDAAFNARFLDEVRRHRRLDHPRIIQVLGTFACDGRVCLVMELAEGGSLATLLDHSPGRRLPLAVATPIVVDVLSALDCAHRHGVWHRDVKPSNILISLSGQAYLSDFGIALALGEERRTRTGVPVGTAEYMSPEQIRTPQSLDHRTDVYSVGCVVYEMLTGRPPFIASDFRGDSDFAVRAAHVNTDPVRPRQRESSIPVAIEAVIMKALAKAPNERLPGCAEFARQFVAAAEDTPNAAELGARPVRAVLIIAVLAAAGFFLLVWTMSFGR